MVEARIKINLNDGTIELEGSESFVERHYAELKPHLENLIVKTPKGTLPTPKKSPRVRTAKQEKKPISYAPIPLDLKAGQNKIALKEFFKEKNPTSNQEIITVFAYYLDKYCKISDMEFGHAISCYNETNQRKPKNLLSLCNNVRNRGGWLESGTQPYTFKINISGQNLIEHDLPHKTEK